MPKGQGRSSEQGVKLLYIRDYLHKYTNKEHPKNAKDISEYLASKGIKAERKTIYNDIFRLQVDFQEPIEYDPKKHGYYITEPQFNTQDLRILMDCIQYADFITMEESSRLVGKVKELGSIYDKELFDRPVEPEVKDSKAQRSVFRNIEIIAQAIQEKKKISFRRLVLVAEHTNHTKETETVHIVSPHKISWVKGAHILSYAAEFSDRDKTYDPYGFGFLRADGITEKIYAYCDITFMCDIKILSVPSVYSTTEEHNSLQELEENLDKRFGSKRAITIQFPMYAIHQVLEKLGKDAILIPIDDSYFKTTILRRTDGDFYTWLYTFGTNAKILSPPDVVNEYLLMLESRVFALRRFYVHGETTFEHTKWIGP